MRLNYQPLIITLLFVFFFYPSYPQSISTMQSQYRQVFIAGDFDNALVIIEKDILSSGFNEGSALAWTTIHRIKGDLDMALSKVNEQSKARLKLTADLLALDDQREEAEMAKRFSPEYLKSHGSVMDSYIWIEGTQMIDPTAGYQLALIKLAEFGENFRLTWMIGTLARNHMAIFAQVNEDIKAGKLDAFPASKQYLMSSLEEPTSKSLNELLYIDHYLLSHPEDGMAMRYKAHQLRDAGRHKQAADLYYKAWQENPFYVNGINLQDAYKSEVKAGHLEEGKKKLEQYNALYHPGEQELYNATEWASIHLATGNYDAAREILLSVKDKFSQSPSYNLAFGKLEGASQRKALAIQYFEAAYRLGAKTIEYYDALVDGYMGNGQAAEALELVGRLEAASKLPLNYFYKKAKVYEDGGDFKTAYEIRKESIKVFPNSSWHWNNYAYACSQTGKPKEAQDAILKVAGLANPSDWTAGRVFDYVKTNEGEAAALEALLKLGKKYPWNSSVWKIYSGKLKKDKVSIYENEVMTYSKRFLFPHETLINEHIDNGNWDEADMAIDNARQLFTNPAERKELAYYESENIRRRSQKQKLRKEEIEKAMHAARIYAELMGSKDEYWYRDMATFHVAAGERKKSVAYLDSGLHVNPDAKIILSLIRNDLAEEYGVGRLSLKYWEHLHRNSYDINRYVDVIDFHVKWGGSPIAAIILSQKVKELLPDGYDKVKNLEVMAYGSLGDNVKDFEIRYAKENVISASERYIGWYNNSRRAVWKGSAKVDVDVNTATATIQFPDGTVAQRQDDIITGKVKLIQVGNAFIKAAYDHDGFLTKMESSNGKRLELTYNERHEISEIKTEDNTILKIVYNNMRKPTRIEWQGTGHMEISYSDGVEIEEVKTFDSAGKEGGTQLATRITNTFQQMIALTNTLKQAHVVSQAKLPDLGIEDSQRKSMKRNLTALEEELSVKPNAKKQVDWFAQSIEYARYLKDHTHINAEYAEECFALLAETRQAFIQHKQSKILPYGPQVAALFHDLLMKTRRNGVALDWWGEWIDTQEWLQKEKQGETKLTAYRAAIEKVQDKIKSEPVELLSTAEWLPKSPLQNTGHWKRYGIKTIVKKEYQADFQVNTLFKRRNGDILVGTNKGLLIRHHGYWDHVMFNPLQMQMERKMDNAKIKASSHVLSMVESGEELWLGTADGILVIAGGQYPGKVARRISQLDGLPVNSVDHIAFHNGKIHIGTSGGLYSLEGNNFVASTVKQKVKFLRNQEVWNEPLMVMEEKLLVGTPGGLWTVSGNEIPVQTTNYEVQDALVSEYGYLHILRNNAIFRYEDNMFVELYGNIVTTAANQVFGLANVPVNDGDVMEPQYAVAALTDLGLSLYHSQHFEYFSLPLKDDLAPMARAFAGHGNGFAIHTGEEIQVYEIDQVKKVDNEKVFDIITSNELGVTFIARSTGLYYTLHSDPQRELQMLDYIYSTALALDQSNRLVTNDGPRIMRYTWQQAEKNFLSEELFFVDQYEPGDANWIKSGDVKNILVATDQTIWVSTKLSVFHYRGTQDGLPEVDEFNYFLSAKKFPAATHMIYRVLQLPDGRIWAVASNEGHLAYKGIYLRGGLLEWDKATDQFNLLDVNNNYQTRGFNWFLTSVTAINSDKAIVGTLGGFAEYNKGEIRDYYSSGGGLKNSSYDNVYAKFPSLFLGTKGDHLGDLWLFGSAAGVVAWHQGTWFYPDRLNQMLPKDNEYGNYGGRVVNAIATDQAGRVYVGTDLGLLIYDSQGADPVSFLINNGEIENAFSVQNESILHQESGSVFKSISKTSAAGKIVTEIDAINAEISRLEKLKAENQQHTMSRGSASQSLLHNDSITTLIANRQKQHYELLLKLEKQDPAIHQLLDVKPVEVAALRKNLKPNECLVQYIPTAGKLYIQVLANNRLELREVLVKNDTLMKMGRFVANAIKLKMEMDELRGSLAWLYDQLLRPIENDISEYTNIMVVPVQSLYYLPFAALVDEAMGKQPVYAVDRFNIAYVSSTYLLGLLLKTQVEASDRYLLFGNPDGSLPGAGEEVKAISSITGKGDLFLNKQATLANFEHNAAKSRIVHLATHGYLNEEAPEQSSILLADKKLTMPQIFNLSLDHTEMIVLSACETGKGLANGMEYATIARAFANAGTPSVLATLWKVDDLATKDLMVSFYKAFEKSDTRLLSLGNAQREFLKTHPGQEHPYYWAGFILMGKP